MLVLAYGMLWGTVQTPPRQDKELRWVGTSRDDLRAFPEDVKDVIGFALRIAQRGGKHAAAKPLKGFHGAGVLEIVDDYDGDTYRAVYTVKLADVVYVLHAFQKKAKHGIATPRAELEKIAARLRQAEADHAARPAAIGRGGR
jgi:phage-related protein